MIEPDGAMRVECHYYTFPGNIDDVPAWRHLQTVEDRLELRWLRLDGEWYRRLIRNRGGVPIPAVGIWNPETDMTVVIVGQEFPDKEILLREVHGPVLPEQLRQEEWSMGA